jgi:hypothetical protein
MTVAALVAAIAAAGLVWGLAEIRGQAEAPPERKPETTAIRGPTLEANTGGIINAQGATIPGDLPFQFGKVTMGGLIDMPGIKVTRKDDGTFSVQPSGEPINRAFPHPTGEFQGFGDDQLRQKARSLAEDLRDFQQRFEIEFRALPRSPKTGVADADFQPFYEKWRLEFQGKYINEAHSLASEYLSRGHEITARDRTESSGGVTVLYKSFAGFDAASRAAAFLDCIASDGSKPDQQK